MRSRLNFPIGDITPFFRMSENSEIRMRCPSFPGNFPAAGHPGNPQGAWPRQPISRETPRPNPMGIPPESRLRRPSSRVMRFHGNAFTGKRTVEFAGEFHGQCAPHGFLGKFPGALDAQPWHLPGNFPAAHPSSREIPREIPRAVFPGEPPGGFPEFPWKLPAKRTPHPKKLDPVGDQWSFSAILTQHNASSVTILYIFLWFILCNSH